MFDVIEGHGEGGDGGAIEGVGGDCAAAFSWWGVGMGSDWEGWVAIIKHRVAGVGAAKILFVEFFNIWQSSMSSAV